MKKLSTTELSEFTTIILNEAKSTSGTWSLSTYDLIKSNATLFNDNDCKFFLEQVVNHIENGNPSEKYKLSQLCSILHSMNNPIIESFFQSEKHRFDKIYEGISVVPGAGSDLPLLIASHKLLKSLYTERFPRRLSIQPTSTNLFNRRIMGFSSSKTPDPV